MILVNVSLEKKSPPLLWDMLSRLKCQRTFCSEVLSTVHLKLNAINKEKADSGNKSIRRKTRNNKPINNLSDQIW